MAAFFRAPSNNRENFMKLVRFGAPDREKPGILDAQGRIRDLSKVIPDIAGDELSGGQPPHQVQAGVFRMHREVPLP